MLCTAEAGNHTKERYSVSWYELSRSGVEKG
jgi:hypothetical protein